MDLTLTYSDPFDTSDPFENQRGTPSIEAAVTKSDKIHIRECKSKSRSIGARDYIDI